MLLQKKALQKKALQKKALDFCLENQFCDRRKMLAHAHSRGGKRVTTFAEKVPTENQEGSS